MRISDWSSDVCSSDHAHAHHVHAHHTHDGHTHLPTPAEARALHGWRDTAAIVLAVGLRPCTGAVLVLLFALAQSAFLIGALSSLAMRSEEHTSELQSLMRISYAVFCLKKKK